MTHIKLRHIYTADIIRALSSNVFFYLILLSFGLQACWMAVTGAYAMAFDEYFHVGIIKLYSHQLSPFLSRQPAGPAYYGAVTRDPSYLFQYLMSFPYRLLLHISANFQTQIVVLRLIDVAVFIVGLIVFRKVLRLAGVSRAMAHVILLFFTVIPVTSFLAGQVNYDNFLFLATGLSFYLAITVCQHIRGTESIPVHRTLILCITLLLGSLVKYAFLPIMIGIIIYVLICVWNKMGLHYKQLWRALVYGSESMKSVAGITVGIFVILSLGLFIQRYGINTLRYHTPVPACNQVLDINRCRAYEPFGRNQKDKDEKLKDRLNNYVKIGYPMHWTTLSMHSLFDTIGPHQLLYPDGDPLPIAYVTGWIVGIMGILLIIYKFRWLWSYNSVLPLFIIVSLIYWIVLFLQNYSDFLHLGVPVAVHGRYLIPILIPVMALAALAAKDVVKKYIKQRVSLAIIAVLFIFMLLGGGFIPYVVRSNSTWMWHSPAVQSGTNSIRVIFKFFVPYT